MVELSSPKNLRGLLMDEKMRPTIERVTAEHLLVDCRAKKKMTIDSIAEKVFPNQKVEASRMKIHRYLKPQRTGQPKNMYLYDFIAICDALELDPVRELANVLNKVSEQSECADGESASMK